MKRLRLEIELIPQTSFFTNVRSMVSDETWDRLRKECYRKAGWRCEICGGKGSRWPVECHEVWEYDFRLCVQKLIRLISLCPSCHEVKHLGLAEVRGRRAEAAAHFAKVNNLSDAEAERRIELAWNEWRRKNAVRWSLDVSILNLEVNP